jgi:hypothetical protein
VLDRHVVLGDFDDDARVRGREEEPPNDDGSGVPCPAIGIFTDAKWSGLCLVFTMSKPYQPLIGMNYQHMTVTD